MDIMIINTVGNGFTVAKEKEMSNQFMATFDDAINYVEQSWGDWIYTSFEVLNTDEDKENAIDNITIRCVDWMARQIWERFPTNMNLGFLTKGQKHEIENLAMESVNRVL